MFGTIKAGLANLNKMLGLADWFARRAERNEYREAGRVELERDHLRESIKGAKEASEIREDVARMSGERLDDELRK